MDKMRKTDLGRGKNNCKGPAEDTSLSCLRNSKEVRVASAQGWMGQEQVGVPTCGWEYAAEASLCKALLTALSVIASSLLLG